MRATADVERDLATWFHAEAPASAPAGLTEDIAVAVAGASRRPGWLPVPGWSDTIRGIAGGHARLVAVAVAIALIAAASLLVAGSPQPAPQPFSLGRPGAIVLNLDGALFSVTPDGTRRTRLTTKALGDSNPVFSPDGSLLAFWSARASWNEDDGQVERTVELVVGSPDLSERRVVDTLHPAPEMDGPRLAWSPDGRRLAYTRPAGRDELVIVTIDEPGAPTIGDPMVQGVNPVFSPDGSLLAYGSGSGLSVVRLDGTGVRRITRDEPDTTTPIAWSPDGRTLAYSTCDATCHLLTIGVDGTGRRELDPDGGIGAAWSPDGRRLAWLHTGADGAWYVVADADGGHRLEFRNDGIPRHGGVYDATAPIVGWSPDGRHITGILASSGGFTFDRIVVVDTTDGTQTIIDAPDLRSWDQQRLAP